MRAQQVGAVDPPSRLIARIVATSMIQTSETGIRTFQPNLMNWS